MRYSFGSFVLACGMLACAHEVPIASHGPKEITPSTPVEVALDGGYRTGLVVEKDLYTIKVMEVAGLSSYQINRIGKGRYQVHVPGNDTIYTIAQQASLIYKLEKQFKGEVLYTAQVDLHKYQSFFSEKQPDLLTLFFGDVMLIDGRSQKNGSYTYHRHPHKTPVKA